MHAKRAKLPVAFVLQGKQKSPFALPPLPRIRCNRDSRIRLRKSQHKVNFFCDLLPRNSRAPVRHDTFVTRKRPSQRGSRKEHKRAQDVGSCACRNTVSIIGILFCGLLCCLWLRDFVSWNHLAMHLSFAKVSSQWLSFLAFVSFVVIKVDLRSSLR